MNETSTSSELTFQLIVESAPNAMVLINKEGVIILVNKKAEELFGYTRQELVGSSIETLIPERFHGHHPGHRDIFFIRPATRPMGVGRELFARRKDGSEFPVEIGLNPIETKDGLVVLASVIDISERKKFEEQQSLFTSIINSSDDAILSKNLEGEILSWNYGAEKVFGYHEKEIVGKHISILIPHHLRDEESEIIMRIRNGDSIDHYETERIRKDGELITVTLSVSPIRDSTGRIIGASKISRDITDTKRAEKKIIKSNRLYAFLSAVNKSIVHIKDEGQLLNRVCDIGATIGNYKMVRIGMLDKNGMLDILAVHSDKDTASVIERYSGQDYSSEELRDTLTGRVLATGRYWLTNDVRSHANMNPLKEIMIQSGIKSAIVLPLKKFGKTIGVLNVAADVEDFFDDDEISLLDEAANDISFALETFEKEKERVLAQEKLIREDIKLKQAQAVAHVGSWELDFATGIAIWSEEACRIFGVPIEDNIQSAKAFYGLTHPEDLSALMKVVSESNATHTDSNVDNRIVLKDGTVKYIHTERRFEFDKDGKAKGLYGITQDVTEQKLAEEKILKATRLYAFISSVNKSIVYLDNEKTLLDNICQIALEVGGFKMAWAGMLDANNKLNIVSVAGDEEGILRTRKYSGVDRDDPLLENIPTGKVLRTGKYAFNNDMQSDPAYAIWKSEFEMQGINSSIGLPIFRFGEVVGVFSLQSGKKNFFDRDEIALVQEAADNISFALENLEREKQRIEIEEALRKSEVNLRTIFDNTDVGFLLMDIDYNIIASNATIQGWAKISFGEELEKGENLMNKLRPEFLVEYYQMMKMLKERGHFINEAFYPDIEGEEKWYLVSGKYVIDDAGKSIGICLAVTDISEKKAAEQQIEFDKNNLDALINNTTDLMWSVDRDYKLITYNDPMDEAIYQATGRHLVEGVDILSFSLSKQQSNLYKTFYDRAFAGEVFTELEYMGEPVDAWLELSFYPIMRGGEIIGSACHSQDVTERKKTEIEIHELNEKLKDANTELLTILNTLPANIALLNEKGVIIAVDEAWKKFADENNMQSDNYGVGDNYLDVCQKATGAEMHDALEMASGVSKVLNGHEQKFAMEYPCHSPVEQRWFRVEVRPLVENERSGAVVMHINITERKEAENKIVQLNESLEVRVQERTAELSEANKALEAFSYSVSHDLQAPIRTMAGFTKIIKQEYAAQLDPELNKLLGFIDSGSKRMSELIDDLLKLAKYDKEVLRLAPVNMTELINRTWANISRSNPNHAVLELAELPEVQADSSLIQQVVINLLTNAVKYSSKKEKPVVSVWAEQTIENTTFYFKDNGAGFDMTMHQRLFGAFNRLHGVSEFEGTGIGLTLVKRIIEKHGGTVDGEGKVGEGATFYFTLPNR